MLERAQRASYQGASLKELPDVLEDHSFDRVKNLYHLKNDYKKNIIFIKQDIRREMPSGLFHIIFCRYLVFTYFTISLQEEILQKMVDILLPGGFLILGSHEKLPPGDFQLERWREDTLVYHKLILS